MYSLRNVPILYVSDPDLVKEIGLCTSLDLGKPSHLQGEQWPLFGHGIFRSNGQEWVHQRKIIAPKFFMDKVKVISTKYSFLSFLFNSLFSFKFQFEETDLCVLGAWTLFLCLWAIDPFF